MSVYCISLMLVYEQLVDFCESIYLWGSLQILDDLCNPVDNSDYPFGSVIKLGTKETSWDGILWSTPASVLIKGLSKS